MNLFQKYGIKEVADVVFYSINEIGDEEFYTPVLYLDTLKVSTLEKTSEKVFAQGGYGNKRLIGWNFGKEITLALEDALFSPASMSLLWGGQLNSKLSDYTSAIVKCNLANKYGELHYSTKAYPSPALTDEEWNCVFEASVRKINLMSKQQTLFIAQQVDDDYPEVKAALETLANTLGRYGMSEEDNAAVMRAVENLKNEIARHPDSEIIVINNKETTIQRELNIRIYSPCMAYDKENVEFDKELKKETVYHYFKRDQNTASGVPFAIEDYIIENLKDKISKLSDIGYIDTKREDTEVIDRMEKCIVTKKEGFVIDTKKQKENLFRYYTNDSSSSYVIYYDAKTMLPLLHIENDEIIGWNASRDEDATFRLKLGTVYYKWTRTVKKVNSDDSGVLGRQLVIDAETFPDSYRIVGETYIREQKTGKDQRYQFTIFKANVSADTSVTLQADGDPTTFSMTIDVLTPPNDIMMELKEYNVEEDTFEGGTRIVPQKSKYTYTPSNIEYLQEVAESNDEIY